MTLYGFFFYLISAVVIGATAIAITRRNLVHAVVYLIVSYFGTAMLFYLFGAPLLAALEIIIYAGAIMVLFLFVVMMIKVESPEEVMFPLSQWLPAAIFGLIYLAAAVVMIVETPGTEVSLRMLTATPSTIRSVCFRASLVFNRGHLDLASARTDRGAVSRDRQRRAPSRAGDADSISTPPRGGLRRS